MYLNCDGLDAWLNSEVERYYADDEPYSETDCTGTIWYTWDCVATIALAQLGYRYDFIPLPDAPPAAPPPDADDAPYTDAASRGYRIALAEFGSLAGLHAAMQQAHDDARALARYAAEMFGQPGNED